MSLCEPNNFEGSHEDTKKGRKVQNRHAELVSASIVQHKTEYERQNGPWNEMTAGQTRSG
jgi:hypothetical protein